MKGPTERALASYHEDVGRDSAPLGAVLFTADNGKRYVILRGVDEVRAVYSVRANGDVARLRRWPAELDNPPPDQ